MSEHHRGFASVLGAAWGSFRRALGQHTAATHAATPPTTRRRARVVVKRRSPTEVPSRHQHPGRPFRPVAEADLMLSMLDLAAGLRGADQGVLALSELKGPFGVADLLVVVGSHDALQSRVATGIPPLLSEIDALIVGALARDRGLRVDQLMTSTGVTEPVINRRLASLRRLEAVREVRGVWHADQRLRPVGRMYAFEAKTHAWRDGLDQACRYQLWTHASTLVMGRLSEAPEALLSRVAQRGLGLAGPDGWIVRPRIQQRDLGRALWGSEHVIAGLLGRRPTLPVHEAH